MFLYKFLMINFMREIGQAEPRVLAACGWTKPASTKSDFASKV
jgi:hypothetical protein